MWEAGEKIVAMLMGGVNTPQSGRLNGGGNGDVVVNGVRVEVKTWRKRPPQYDRHGNPIVWVRVVDEVARKIEVIVMPLAPHPLDTHCQVVLSGGEVWDVAYSQEAIDKLLLLQQEKPKKEGKGYVPPLPF